MKQPKGRGKHVLYLDFDGVLHHEDVWRHPRRGLYFGPKGVGHTLFENAPLLEHLLTPYPNVHIVLSTSWVPSLRYSRAVSKLPPSLKARVVGATFHTRMNRNLFDCLTRAHQVLDDVDRRQPGAWVAVDDALGWPKESLPHFVACDPVAGIADPEVTRDLVAKLQLHFGRPAEGPGKAPTPKA
ncbi:HAD domain-containing protein [Acidovorax sp. CF316]|uniref:HAD domain-containing protein n=1 Tax=Acidovorax sp. CF316 TaxID=1144317 RepID=UPI00068CC355|nr:HAD domain-containing protein [Acidovorax sp. CF316]